jgi:squalene-hopene/tetraprenyl-beta-curcumene cyclase
MKSLLRKRVLAVAALALFAGAGAHFALAGDKAGKTAGTETWDPKAAASYLDQRAKWWIGWDHAAREQGTFCMSCHTAVPYVIARPVLHRALSESAPSENERVILQNVARRVRMWKDLAPLYDDKDYGANKGVESRGTESVVLTFVLATHDAQSGKFSADSRAAFANMWALQQTDGPRRGAWLWQLFDLNPWEGNISPYHGAALAAVAVGEAPENYRASPEIQNNIAALQDYLDREYSSQPLLNRAALLWASTKLPGLITAERQKSIIEELSARQLTDGGWSLFPMSKTWRDWSPSALVGDWKRSDGTPQDMTSDGYATGFTVFVLRQAGVPRDDPRIQRGRAWLVQHQNKTEGLWYTASINKRRDPASNVGRFMSDAATAYAVLALTE